MTYVWQCVEAIDAVLDNIHFPLGDEAKLRELEAGFNELSKWRLPGTVAAGDGVVFRMQRPTKEATEGDVSSFFTRKGYYAYAMQGFVDSKCRFLNISMRIASSSHDSTAYLVSDLSEAIRKGRLAEWAQCVILFLMRLIRTRPRTFSLQGENLDVWDDDFNSFLSRHRQCIERAFGILVQPWSIFWRALRVKFSRIPLLIRVCCRLHNFIIDKFGMEQVSIAGGDAREGDIASAMFTDGTGHT